mmetsp:Transcript_26653/g.31017  ORF Transcript_26653/g.31017 Transcript_26653/m.31017 type:complete len:103 (-) Transcript_26653:85-393(-)
MRLKLSLIEYSENLSTEEVSVSVVVVDDADSVDFFEADKDLSETLSVILSWLLMNFGIKKVFLGMLANPCKGTTKDKTTKMNVKEVEYIIVPFQLPGIDIVC